MASSGNMLPEKQFQCSVCQQVFTDPVTTPCGHNFCQACLRALWDGGDGGDDVCRCPACDRTFTPRPEVSVNAAFKELADTFRRRAVVCSSAAQPGEVVCDVCAAAGLQVKALKSCLACLTSYCGVHLEPHRGVSALKLHKLIEPAGNLQDRMCRKHERLLEMFCRDENKCVCSFCTETAHKGHRVVTVEQESEERKVQMKTTEADFQQMIQERLKKVEEIRSCLKLSAASAEREKKESERLFTSLIRSAEGRRAEALTEVEEQQQAAARRADELVDELQQEVAVLRRRNAELQELENTDDHLHLLQTLPSLTAPPPSRQWAELGVHPELCVGTLRRALSDVDAGLKTELDGLKREEMKRMQKYAVDVVLDQDTAHPNIVLSADGKQAGRGELLHLVPDNPQRFDPVICVLASRGFLSGRFYFQVAVGTKTFWDLGVVKESVNRKGMITSKPENGFWAGADEERGRVPGPGLALGASVARAEAPDRSGVFVDYEAGRCRSSAWESGSHMYSFTGCPFSERIFPFFSPGVCDEGRNKAPLVIAAVNPEGST
uniref:E3 ubiquitin-protein ligase TRIM39-like n=1 Tax=Scophthalmus maximus TaxID=52904 RepID=A0A8D3CXJ2_SCOMX